ncbi:MAG: DNA mismatch repair endonuclease MutL [Clostridiaceae bacterium]|uniref:DNA mismatch repair endonuclease MutL n=1 Tax=Clostridium sp. MCC328 TaxID=2592642 RepID=UPI001C030F6E|nr:DNA mismatch repair endonuclease MutL [Clostridium sp. MCC328]MBT9819500.1 DNA mismatch repair endonuclease MutL [Clostridium sp. MCC328]
MPIQVLDQSTINQIAAGEVVERPASVVKELMENAIDAGSTAITVEIRQGGIGFIRITDNGCGIKKEELPLAFLRHSTSKIRTAEDLLTVSSLGFRGEALSSIAAVSQVELITKTSGSLTGSRYRIEGGEEIGLEEIGAPDGTTFISRNLFFNTPARRKFLKTETTEGAHVADLVEKIALSHPEISIRFIVNNQSRLHTSGNHNLKDIIYTVYGREIAANLLPVEVSNGIVKISGFIGKPVIARGNRNFENYFINGRYIKSGLVSKAIEDGYKSYMMQHKYPFTLLHLTVEPEFIDVNVHPSKMELRFKDGENMYRVICQAVMDALSGKELIPNVSLMSEREERELEKKETAAAGSPILGSGMNQPAKNAHGPEPFEHRRMEAMGIREERPAYGEKKQESKWILPPKPLTRELPPERAQAQQPNETGAGAMPAALEEKAPETTGAALAAKKAVPAEKEAPLAEKEALPKQMEMFDNRLLSETARKRHRLIGQVFETYWLVEYDGSLYIIDQHAAHEKVLFEKNFASLKTREYTSQLVSPPIILTLSLQEADLLKRHMKVFTDIGFEIEPFGGNEYAVRAVPDNLFSLAKKDLLMELIDGLSDESMGKNVESIYDRIATMSCKAAVKGNNELSFAEADKLIDELLKLENPYNCPHGRPTIVAISKYEMEKKFKRII